VYNIYSPMSKATRFRHSIHAGVNWISNRVRHFGRSGRKVKRLVKFRVDAPHQVLVLVRNIQISLIFGYVNVETTYFIKSQHIIATSLCITWEV